MVEQSELNAKLIMQANADKQLLIQQANAQQHSVRQRVISLEQGQTEREKVETAQREQMEAELHHLRVIGAMKDQQLEDFRHDLEVTRKIAEDRILPRSDTVSFTQPSFKADTTSSTLAGK